MDYFATDDTEYQILGRVPLLQTLDRCKAVCKRWYNIINEVSFLPFYCKNTTNLYGYIVQVWDYRSTRKYSKSFLSINQNEHNNFIPSYTFVKCDDDDDSKTELNFDGHVQIVASSMQGILCCGKEEAQFYVCKPMTGQWKKIPRPRSSRDMVGLIILSDKPLRYKIVWISRQYSDVDRCCKYWHEIFDSKTWKWGVRVELLLPFSKRAWNKPGIQVGRVLYFLMDTLVHAFHGDYENTFQILLPQSLSLIEQNAHSTISPIVKRNLTEYQGSLGFICMTWIASFTTMQLWILEDQETPTWKKIKEVDMRFLGLNSGVFYPLGFYNGNILVLRKYDESLILCNFQDLTNKELKLNNLDTVPETFPFRSDREPVDLRYVDRRGVTNLDNIDRGGVTNLDNIDRRGVSYLDYIHRGVCKIGNVLLITIGLFLLAIMVYLCVITIWGALTSLP